MARRFKIQELEDFLIIGYGANKEILGELAQLPNEYELYHFTKKNKLHVEAACLLWRKYKKQRGV